jgi:hypothetical protein
VAGGSSGWLLLLAISLSVAVMIEFILWAVLGGWLFCVAVAIIVLLGLWAKKHTKDYDLLDWTLGAFLAVALGLFLVGLAK